MPDNDIDAIKRDLHDSFDRMIDNSRPRESYIDTPELFPRLPPSAIPRGIAMY